MSQAHKSSRLIIQDVTYAVPYESLHISFNQDATGIQNGNIVYPNSGSIYTMRNNEGKFGGAVAVEEGTTNLLSGKTVATNSIRLEDIKGWEVTGIGNDTRKQITTVGIEVSALTTYTFSGVYWSSSGVLDDVYIGFNDNGWTEGGYYHQPFEGQGGKSTVVITDLGLGYKRYSATFTTNANTTTISSIFFDSDIVGQVCFIGDVQLEKKSYATSYINGSRNTGFLAYDSSIIKNSAEATVSFWFKAETLINVPYKVIFRCGTWANQEGGLGITTNSSNTVFFEYGKSSSGFSTLYSNTSLKVGGWYFLSATWTPTTLSLYIGDAVLGTFKSHSLQATVPALNFAYPISLARDAGTMSSSDNGMGVFDELRIQRTAASEEEIMSWFVANRPFYNPYDYRGYTY